MRWCRIANEDGQSAVVAEVSLVVHEPRGWKRVSDFASDPDSVDPYQYAAEPVVKPTKPAAKPAKSTEEK